jgi:hypothetical protein
MLRMRNIIILQNGSRNEAHQKFDEVRKSITDFKQESVSIHGDIRNEKEGWSVIKTHF